MSYFSVVYILAFLPIVIFIYNLFPKKIKPFILLIASYVFFMIYSRLLILFLIISSLSVYFAGIELRNFNRLRDEKLKEVTKEEKKVIKDKYNKLKKWTLIVTIIFNLSFLFFFKYLGFFTNITNYFLGISKVSLCFKIIRHIAPIGISFYTLQAISYIVDVYRGKFEAETSLLKVLLYLSFFPTIVEGPITRYDQMNSTLYEGNKVTYHNFCFGYQRIFWGLFKKLVIADRLNAFVKITFGHYMNYSGITLALGALFYTILLYMEFSGTMDVVIGSAEIFGINVPENFRQPFFSKNISEFWSRWHISLGTWLKDYIFYPVSLSKFVKKICGKIKKLFGNRASAVVMGAIALFAVWSLNGLWHGAGWNYLFFGYYHFMLIFLGNLFEPVIAKCCNKIGIDRKKLWYKVLQVLKTCILIVIGELFFRAKGLYAGLEMFGIIISDIHLHGLKAEISSLGIDIKDYIILALSLIVVLVISILKERKVNIREKISEKHIVIRWLLYYALLFGIIVFGAYGSGYTPVEPIYADF